MQHGLRRLVSYGVAFAHRLGTPLDRTKTPPAKASRAVVRALRAVEWALALAAVLTGQITLRPSRAGRAAPAPSAPHPVSAGPARYGEPWGVSLTGLTRAMRAAFRTQTIGQIARSLCADLGIAEHTELWPTPIADLTQTPLDWVRQRPLRTARRPRHRPTRAIPTRAIPTRPAHLVPPPTSSRRRLLLAGTAPRALFARQAGAAPPRWRP